MSALKNFYKHLKELRGKDKNFVTNFAETAGVSRALVNGWLNEKGEPGLDLAEKVAKATGSSLIAFVGDDKPTYAAPRKPTPEEMALHILESLHLPENKLSAIRAILLASKGELLGITAACLPVIERVSSKGNQTTG